MTKGVSTDTRQRMPNTLFVPLVESAFDGHEFIADAVQQGAIASFGNGMIHSRFYAASPYFGRRYTGCLTNFSGSCPEE